MKKLVLALFCCSIAFVSCEKDYSCDCTTSSNYSAQGSSSNTYSDSFKNEDDAESWCESYEQESTSTYGGTTYTTKTECDLSEE